MPLLTFGGIIIYKEDIQVVGIFYFAPLIIAGSGANHDILYLSSVMEGVSAGLSCVRILLYLWLFGFI